MTKPLAHLKLRGLGQKMEQSSKRESSLTFPEPISQAARYRVAVCKGRKGTITKEQLQE